MLDVLLNFLVSVLPPNQPLEREDGVLGVDDCLTLRWETNETFAMLRECDDGRCCPVTLSVLNHTGSLSLHDRDARVRRTQVNTNDWACVIYMKTYERLYME